jgi:hypothetical protein
VPLLRRYGELDIDDDLEFLLVAMSAATIDRRLAAAKSRLVLRGRSHTKPGSCLLAGDSSRPPTAAAVLTSPARG